MKKTQLILLLLFFAIASSNVTAQKFEQPQWETPLYFEDATGAKDTVWFGYDQTANIYADEIDEQFGEKWMWIDTSKFNVYITEKYDAANLHYHKDTVLKRNINCRQMHGETLHFTHGQLPVTIKWEDETLNSPNLTAYYPDISPRPRARIDLMFERLPLMDCELIIDGAPDVILTDYIVNFPSCFCALTDSAVIYGTDEPYYDEIYEVIGTTDFSIAPHDYDYFAGTTIEDNDAGFLIYPNPVTNILNIENTKYKNIEISIYDMQAKLVFQQNFENNIVSIDLSSYRKGLYLIKTTTNNKINTYKINKI